MPTGVIKYYSERRGYGFISRTDAAASEARTDGEVFVHYSQVVGREALSEGERVTFEIRRGGRGLEAVNVQRLS